LTGHDIAGSAWNAVDYSGEVDRVIADRAVAVTLVAIEATCSVVDGSGSAVCSG
jgi:hypothetical protein